MKRMPVVFSGHGDPTIAIQNNDITKAMGEVGENIIKEYGKPKAILSISAHWFTRGTFIQNVEVPEQIYDMYGFPDELYEVKYPVKGSKELTKSVIGLLGDKVSVNNKWGIDHGTWTVLVHMFPKDDIPVVQLSVDASITPEECYKLGERLSHLRDEGYLIFGSGNVVHNLRMIDWDNENGSKETIEFNDYVVNKVETRDDKELINYKKIKHSDYAIPTPEHYLPLLYCLGASKEEKTIIFNNKCNLGSIAMTGFIFKD